MSEPDALARRRAELHRPLRPRVSRVVARAVGIATVIVLSVVAVVLPGDGATGFKLLDRLGVVAVGLAVAAVLWWFSLVSALPSESGLRVRNLVGVCDLEWPQIVAVRFGGASPWAVLDLSDGDTLTVMAVQRSDGAYGAGEAQRLATLVALHSRTERDD